jgi:hypothetical protein
MKRFKLLGALLVVLFPARELLGQCTGALTVNVTGSSTGGSLATTITRQPTNQTAILGGIFTLSVVATGVRLTYQWKKNGVDIIPNGTNATYTKSLAMGRDAGVYTVAVRGDCGADVTSTAVIVTLEGVSLQLKAFLEGAYKTADGLMLDVLTTRTPSFSSLIPTIEPFTNLGLTLTGFTHRGGGGNETTTQAVLQVTGNQAIVDWVFIELRAKTNPTIVLYTRSALIQRDGDIVDVDGLSPVIFPAANNDTYYIALKHRNHLGFRPLSNFALSATPTILDFTNNSLTFYGSRPALKQLSTRIYGMCAGDANHNSVINSVDKNSFWRLQNGTRGYLHADFDLNGLVNAVDKNTFWLINNSLIQQLD